MAENRNVAVADDFEATMRLVCILRRIQTKVLSVTNASFESQDARPTRMANNRSPVRWRSTANKSDVSSNPAIMHDLRGKKYVSLACITLLVPHAWRRIEGVSEVPRVK